MNIKTKYNIGDEVYLFSEGEVYKAEISEIDINVDELKVEFVFQMVCFLRESMNHHFSKQQKKFINMLRSKLKN
jgi:hypothetical protein